MTNELDARLNQILPRIASEAFLSSEGIGNEIACYIFDYPARHELIVRDHLTVLLDHLARQTPPVNALHLNLLDVCLDYLAQRRLLDKVIAMESSRGDAAVLGALKGPMAAEKIRDFIAEQHTLDAYDVVLLSGVGSVWPMLRAHSLLNCLHPVLGKTPLVMFYPGSFDGTTLRLFGQIATSTRSAGAKLYYRAFILVPH